MAMQKEQIERQRCAVEIELALDDSPLKPNAFFMHGRGLVAAERKKTQETGADDRGLMGIENAFLRLPHLFGEFLLHIQHRFKIAPGAPIGAVWRAEFFVGHATMRKDRTQPSPPHPNSPHRLSGHTAWSSVATHAPPSAALFRCYLAVELSLHLYSS